MGRLIVHQRADEDLDSLTEWFSVYSVDSAIRFLSATRRAFALVSDWPQAGATVPLRRGGLVGLRVWPIPGFRNYLVCYLPLPDGVHVLRVANGARNLARLIRDA